MTATHTGIKLGRSRGFIVTKLKPLPRRSSKKGGAGDRIKLVKQVIREVAGFAPYERRIMELVKIGTSSTLKRALKFSKRRLGTHSRGKKKRDEIVDAVVQQRRQQAAQHG